MNEKFWQDRWANNQIGFHNHNTNPLLVQHFQAFTLGTAPRVFVPFCGKSRDLVWLAEQGCRVTGAELSELAVEQFFRELDVEPQVTTAGLLRRFEGKGIVIFQGNLFDLTPELVGPVDLVYDRAALVALPPEMRERYAKHLPSVTATAPQLLICYEYDQSCADGPPFSVREQDLRHVYGEQFRLKLLGRSEVEGGMKGKCPSSEAVWQLSVTR